MRVVVAGATGVIGRQLVPLLTSVGHEVVALTRPNGPHGSAEPLGAQSVSADLLDASSVLTAVRGARPDAVVHMATAIPRDLDPRRMTEQFAVTNRLRTEGTRALAQAAAEVNARLITQSVAFAYDPGTGAGAESLADEDEPLWREPPRGFAAALAALVDLERQTSDAGGLVLRFGHLYGPGTSFGADGPLTERVRTGKLPVVGGGRAVFSFVHTHDAATAIVAALDRPSVTGALNVVDDEPAPARTWLAALAELLGARAPRSLPAWLARPLVGEWGVTYFTRLRGADNTRAKIELDWKPRYGSWREGFAEELRSR